jgi:membrane associated rhomboid family serine protease
LASLPADDRLEWIRQWGTVPSKLFDSQAPMLQQLSELRILRLLTALFIHADWLHLAGNLLFPDDIRPAVRTAHSVMGDSSRCIC